MVDLSRDPLNNAIQNGIKDDIEFNLAHNRFRATVILILAGIDAMAFLDMPGSQQDVKAADFIAWAERYISLPCKEQVTGEDLYGARCAMLHSYGAFSKMSRNGNCRVVGWMNESIPEVRFDPAIDPNVVLVSIAALKKAFFTGIDTFLVRAFTDVSRIPLLESRLALLVQAYPAPTGKPMIVSGDQ